MKYDNILPAVFLERLNRFTALIRINNEVVRCHVKNTGRCRELLLPETPVYVQHCPSETRSTAYDLITVCKRDGSLVNLDSQVPNKVVLEWLKAQDSALQLRPEYTWGNSRFDLFIHQHALMEIKGVTLLTENGIARFPDAPTLRGVKHVEELIRAKEEGFDAYVFFVLQMKNVKELRPNDITHPEFGVALRRAHKAGVQLLAYDCMVTPDSIRIDQPIPVVL